MRNRGRLRNDGKWWSPISTIETIGGVTNVNMTAAGIKTALVVGDKVLIQGASVAGYNIIHTVLTVGGTGTFTIANLSLADATGGTVYKL